MRVLVFGTFDRLHPGHRFLLDEALRRGNLHVVIARDRTVESIKGQRPDQSEEERMRAVQKAYPAARVFLGDQSDYLVPIHSVKPDLILLGYDQGLPPGVAEGDLTCAVERLPALRPDLFKSSLRRESGSTESL